MATGDDGFVVVKQVSVCPGNPARGLPAINGAIMVLDAQTGLLRAVLGANRVTAARTAALSLVAARRLADPGSRTLALVGAGVQGRAHLEAFAGQFPLQQVRVLGRGRANVEGLCALARDMGFEAEASAGPQEALRGADLVVTSVTLDYSLQPTLDARWLTPGAFAAIADLCLPWLPDQLPAFGTIVIDDRQQEAESERPMLPAGLVAGDLTELVARGSIRRAEGRPAAFAFRGLALGDYAAAVLAVRRATAAGALPR